MIAVAYATSAVPPSHPPVPPQCCGFDVHDANCCSDNTNSLPVFKNQADSSVSAAANVQHEPARARALEQKEKVKHDYK